MKKKNKEETTLGWKNICLADNYTYNTNVLTTILDSTMSEDFKL